MADYWVSFTWEHEGQRYFRDMVIPYWGPLNAERIEHIRQRLALIAGDVYSNPAITILSIIEIEADEPPTD